MDITKPLALLGNLSPQGFMKRHWQKKPLLIRQAISAFKPLLSRSELFALAARDGVESRLVMRQASRAANKSAWQLKTGPLARRALPSLKTPNWTLLVQGVDLHIQAMRKLMDQFRFVPDARLDDVMVSFATPGGGVGPHFDSYDVFLLQAHGTRRWRISRQKDLALQAGAPLKILKNFVPEQSFDLAPGDMLYLPPGYAHDGTAINECMTYSIGFRAPGQGEFARELLQRIADDAEDDIGNALYQDATQGAVQAAAEIPAGLMAFARKAMLDVASNQQALARALGELLTEPKPSVWFDACDASGEKEFLSSISQGLVLDQRSKMMFDARHIFINGESFAASGRDATLMRQLANERRLNGAACAKVSKGAKSLLQDWLQAGWIHGT
jgi:50S ribosomal protein L16 3-hydroxylase